MKLLFLPILLIQIFLCAASISDDLTIKIHDGIEEVLAKEDIDFVKLKHVLEPIKNVVIQDPDKIPYFSRVVKRLWPAVMRSEKNSTKKIPYYSFLEPLRQAYILPDCATLKQFKRDAEFIAQNRNRNQSSVEDDLLLQLSAISMIADDAEYITFGAKTEDKERAKKRLIIFLEALKECADFFKTEALYKDHPKFVKDIKRLLEYVIFSGDAKSLDAVLALNFPTYLYPIEAIASEEIAEKTFGIKDLKVRYSGYENQLILEMLKWNVEHAVDAAKLPQWRTQRDWIKRELKKLTYDSFPWYYREVVYGGRNKLTNVVSWLVPRDDAELFESLPLMPNAPVLSELATYEFEKDESESPFGRGRSLFSVARSPEWVRKLRALGAQGDISEAGEAAVPVLLEDLAESLSLLN